MKQTDTATVLCTVMSTPVGELTLVASADGLRAILWPDDDPARVPRADSDRADTGDDRGDDTSDCAAGAGDHAGGHDDDHRSDVHDNDVAARRHLVAATQQLGEYFAGERTAFELALDPVGTEFQLAAWRALRDIPYGTVSTYGAQAASMGDRNKARAVGAANGRNPLSIVVPCHRVVGSDGSLTGFAGGVDTKAWLLDHERAVLAAT